MNKIIRISHKAPHREPIQTGTLVKLVTFLVFHLFPTPWIARHEMGLYSGQRVMIFSRMHRGGSLTLVR